MSDMSRGKKWLFSFGTKSLEQKSNMLTWSADAGAFNLFVHSADLDTVVKREFRLFLWRSGKRTTHFFLKQREDLLVRELLLAC